MNQTLRQRNEALLERNEAFLRRLNLLPIEPNPALVKQATYIVEQGRPLFNLPEEDSHV